MTQHSVNGIQIECEVHGDPNLQALVLVRGLGTQLIDWPDSFIQGFVAAGYFVVTFDNRDVGLSQKFDDYGKPDLGAIVKQEKTAPYSIHDMADDIIGLLDALEIEKAHVFGISMGGMITQVLAAAHGDRLLSMLSVMSSSGRAGLPAATPAAQESLQSSAPDDADEETIAALTAEGLKICGSPGYPESLETRLEIGRRRYRRNHNPNGVSRQMSAVIASGDREPLLRSIKVPAMVIHGEDDPLIPKEAGIDTAECIPDCELKLIPGMGHNIPEGLVPELLNVTIEFIRRHPE